MGFQRKILEYLFCFFLLYVIYLKISITKISLLHRFIIYDIQVKITYQLICFFTVGIHPLYCLTKISFRYWKVYVLIEILSQILQAKLLNHNFTTTNKCVIYKNINFRFQCKIYATYFHYFKDFMSNFIHQKFHSSNFMFQNLFFLDSQ